MRSLIEAWGLGEDSFLLLWANWSFWCRHRQFPPVSRDLSLTARSSESHTLLFSNTPSSPWCLFQIEGSGHGRVPQLTRMCTCTHTWTHTHTWTCADMDTCTHTHVDMHMHTPMHTHGHTCAHMWTHTLTHTFPFESWNHKLLLLPLTLYSSVILTAILSKA